MKLVRSEDLRLRLGLGNVDTLVAAADNAAEEATLHLENDIRTSLQRATYEDVYLVHPSDRGMDRLVLKLSAGFVLTGWQVGTGVTRAVAAVDTTLTSQVSLNQEQGLVLLTNEITILDRYVSVRYTAGFALATGSNPGGLLDVSSAPFWLTKGAELKAISLIADSPEFNNKEGTTIDAKAYSKQYVKMIEKHIRYAPDSRQPVN